MGNILAPGHELNNYCHFSFAIILKNKMITRLFCDRRGQSGCAAICCVIKCDSISLEYLIGKALKSWNSHGQRTGNLYKITFQLESHIKPMPHLEPGKTPIPTSLKNDQNLLGPSQTTWESSWGTRTLVGSHSHFKLLTSLGVTNTFLGLNSLRTI